MNEKPFWIFALLTFVVNGLLVCGLVYLTCTGLMYIGQHGLKSVAKRLWEGPAKP